MSDPSYARTGLTREQYLAHWNADRAKFLAAARGNLDARVPTCPEWTVTDLAHHLANVYQHKTWVLELGAFPDESDFTDARDARAGRDPLERVEIHAQELQAMLTERADDDVAATFMPSQQEVAFWFRRMALETLVHRTDAELAKGELGSMDDALSDDGVDEMLWMLSEFGEAAESGWHGQHVALRSPRHSWTVTLDPSGPQITAGALDQLDATISAPSGDLLLFTAGRSVRPVTIGGDTASADELRRQFQEF